MKLIKPSYTILEQDSSLEGIYKIIEQAGRTCYKSFNKITEDSAKPFVDRMMSNHHLSVLEHGTVYLAIPYDYVDISCKLEVPIVSDVVEKYKKNPYTNWHLRDDGFSQLAFITTNYRVLVEHNWLDDLKYLCEPTEYHEKRVTVRMICSIGTSRELNRHRANSISEQSTRYCNFSKDKFNNEISFIIPSWCSDLSEGSCSWDMSTDTYTDNQGIVFSRYNAEEVHFWLSSMNSASQTYMSLLKLGWKPQQAREVLPLATATEVVYTAYIKDWEHFFGLRCSEAAHPSARELAIPLREEFIKRGYIKE